MRSLRSCWTLPLTVACGPEPPERPPAAEVAVVVEPPAALDAVPPVVRLRITGLAVPAAAMVAFEGELSSYHLGRIRDADLPSTLLDRFVPITAFDERSRGEGDAIVVAPSRPLREGGTYTLAALGRGTVAAFTVSSGGGAPFAERLFPRDASAGGTRWVFCGAALPARREIQLEPGAVPGLVRPGLAAGIEPDERCFRLDVIGQATNALIPPPAIDGVALDPTPITVRGPSPDAEARPCDEADVPLGPGCASVLDDRAIVRSASVPLLWALRSATSVTVAATEANGRFVIAGLQPGESVRVEGVAADAFGREYPLRAVLHTLAARPHVIVNEVLANPVGQEPAQEWVELVNDGRAPVSLNGFTLGDADSEAPLPAAVLPPGAFALVVPSAFDVHGHLDRPPVEGTLLLRVPRLGQSGLSNAGERVTLRGPDGVVVSSFPPIAAAKSGTSVSRRSPSTLDDDTAGFVASGGAGKAAASPGSANETPP